MLQMNIIYCFICFILFNNIVLGNQIATKYADEDELYSDVESDAFPCYSCSGKSALCREKMYDGQYLTKALCKTKCFLRVENNEIYRGCFDGWLGGLVKYDYEGCQLQKYLGQTVEWCFCTGNSAEGDEPCNSQSRQSMGGGIVRYNGGKMADENIYEDYLTDNNYIDYDALDESTRINENSVTGKERQDNHYKSECFECHDEFEHCKGKITQPEYVAVKSCHSKCFVRQEQSTTYRGCLDGWIDSGIVYKYNGCAKQFTSGQIVTWCFCDGSLCNGYSVGDFPAAKFSNGESEASEGQGQVAKEGHYDSYKFGLADALASPSYRYTPASRLKPSTMCRGLTNGVYTDPLDCTMYVNCLNGFTYRRKCPPGTAWNVQDGFCDFKDKVAHLCNNKRYKPVDKYYVIDDGKSNYEGNPHQDYYYRNDYSNGYRP